MKSKIIFLLSCLSIVLLAGPKANWILYPEALSEGASNYRYFRKEFNVSNKNNVATAYIFYRIVNSGTVYVNGKSTTGSYTQLSLYTDLNGQYDVTSGIATGTNAICIKAKHNGASNAGLICHLLITYKDGSTQEIFSDDTWKVSKSEQTNWHNASYDASGWTTARALGDYTSEPWIKYFPDMFPFYAKDDADAELERRRQEELKAQQLLEELTNAPVEQARIAYKNGGAFFDIGGTLYRPVLYNYATGGRDTENFRNKVRNFIDADIKLISFGIEAGDFWKGPDQYDYDFLDKQLKDAVTLAPEARFIFAITFCHGPSWWNTLHPEETIRYARIDEKNPSDDCIGNYTAPSYASELWIEESAEAIRKLVEHIEANPYGKHVFGYRIGNGVYSEWVYYGMEYAMPDISSPMVKFFRQFLREKYHDDVEQLRTAWNQPQVTFATALPPPVELRLEYFSEQLRHPTQNAWTIDFLECLQRALRNLLLSMNKAAKEACNGRALVGDYCGYFYGVDYTTEGWILENDEIVDSPYVDFQIGPCCYSSFYRALGRSQLGRNLIASYPLHNKIHIIEADTRTHLTDSSDGSKMAKTVQESIAMLSRDMAQAIGNGCAYWYYDFGKDWYNCPEIFDFFQKIAPVYDAITDFSSSAEIAIIADWESAYYHAIQKPYGGYLGYFAVNYLPRELNNAGLLFDSFPFADIDNPALQNYKVYIFPQLFYMTPEKLAKLASLKKAGKTLIFLNAAGWLTPNGTDDNSVFQATGIQAEVLENTARFTTTLAAGGTMTHSSISGVDYSPVLKVTDSQATILGTVKLDNGTTVNGYAKKQNADGSTSYVSSTPYLSASELRNIASAAGVHSYCDSDNGVVFANNSMIAFHTGTAGTYTLKAKSAVKWKMVYPETQSYPETQATLTFTASQPNTYIFVIEP